MSATYSQIARAFIAGTNVPAPSRTITGRPRLFAERNRLYSYGHHFPLLERAGDAFILNDEQYYPTEEERDDAGFRQSWCSKRDRSKMPSPTTRRQRDEIASELRRAGYAPTGADWIDGAFEATMWEKAGQ